MADNFSLTKYFREQYLKEALSKDNSMFVTPTTGIKKPMKYYITDTKKSNAQLTTKAMRNPNFKAYDKDGEQPYLMEFTDYGQEGTYPKKEKLGDMFQQKEVEELFPIAMASRNDKSLKDRLKQHADWTEQSAYNNTFVHMQYHETEDLDDDYFIYQTQHYNSNYDDFRNPKFTILSITKNKGKDNEEKLGEYIVDTNAYVDDLSNLRAYGNLGKRVMEADLNDPALVKARAAKTKREKILSAPKPKKMRISPKAAELVDGFELEDLQRNLKDIYREMEQDAEPEGGPIADQYADEIDAHEQAIRFIKNQGKERAQMTYNQAIAMNEEDRATRADKIMSGEYEDEDYKDSKRYADVRADLENEIDEGSCGYTPDGKPRNKPAGPDLMELKEKIFNSIKKQ
jgi:hypothetical protein